MLTTRNKTRFVLEDVRTPKEMVESLNRLVDMLEEKAVQANLEPELYELNASGDHQLEPAYRFHFLNVRVNSAATLTLIEHPERPCAVYTTIYIAAHLDDTLTLELDSISEVYTVSHGGSNKHNTFIVIVKNVTGWEVLTVLRS